jgi:hypothetical protein
MPKANIETDSGRVRRRRLVGLTLLAVFAATPYLSAADSDDFDWYELRIDAGWYFSNPSVWNRLGNCGQFPLGLNCAARIFRS